MGMELGPSRAHQRLEGPWVTARAAINIPVSLASIATQNTEPAPHSDSLSSGRHHLVEVSVSDQRHPPGGMLVAQALENALV